MAQVLHHQPILSCGHFTVGVLCSYRACSTLRLLQRSKAVEGVRSSTSHEQSTPSLSVRRAGIRGSAGRRHHRRRDEEFAARLREKETLQRPDKLQMKSSRRNDSDDKVIITLDMEELKRRAADAVIVVQRAAEHSLDKVARAAEDSVDKAVRLAKATAREGEEVWRELRSSVRVQKDKHLVISIRRSSLEFAGKAVLGSILLVVFAKVFLDAMREYRWGWEEGFGRSKRVVRDRSLGGKEVTLNKGVRLWESGTTRTSVNATRGFGGPLDSPVEDSRSEKDLQMKAKARGEGAPAQRKPRRLPGWWPEPDLPPSTAMSTRRRSEEEAHKLVQGIMQKRLTGFDFSAEDILQLRQLCKAGGAKVKFDTYNTRDAFYRAAIDLLLSACQGAGKWSTAEFGSEGGIRFIAGLSSNIGLESERAATMVTAAVAARTRAGLLQARALHMQSKLAESENELLKLIRLHLCFPPDPDSAEMEMVARGLGSHFDKEARIEMLESYERLGGKDTKRVAEEALGLLLPS